MSTRRERSTLLMTTLLILVAGGRHALANERPVADAGLPRYAAKDPVRLDGSGSYAPDRSGPLSYVWTQVAGPSVVITGADTATPTISGFVQTAQIQECKFELIVKDGDMKSSFALTSVLVVPGFGGNLAQLFNSKFDPGKPTIVYFGGGDGTVGTPDPLYGARLPFKSDGWLNRANIVWFPDGYGPDDGPQRTYYKYGDMLIVYLSRVAPDYVQLIQTSGWSTGGQPAIDVGIRMNETYHDIRYAVNRVTLLDAAAYGRDYSESIRRYLASRVAGEQCWVDNYVASIAEHHILRPRPSFPLFYEGVLNVEFDRYADPGIPWLTRHTLGNDWLGGSLDNPTAMLFNQGIVAGAYVSVVGPGENLQLASGSGQQTYQFRWRAGHMEMADEQAFPGRLPEPVIQGAWINLDDASGDVDGAVLSCYECENAVGYQLLVGSDPYRVMDFRVVSDTSLPPTRVIRDLPSEETWWTVRVRDQYGSTIYADPVRLDLTSLPPLSIENARTGRRYGLISHAVLDAEAGDVILLDPATYDENINFGGKTLTVRSLDPNDRAVVARTIIRGRNDGPTVSFAGPESAGSVLAGLTIRNATVGISCRDAVPTIRNCVVESPDGIAIEFWIEHEPRLIGCTLQGRVKELGDPGRIACWKLDEAEGTVAHDSEGKNDATVMGTPFWQPDGGKVKGALQLSGVANYVTVKVVRDPSQGPFSAFAWVKGGAPGQVILSQDNGANWVMAGAPDGVLMTDLKFAGRQAKSLTSTAVITDDAWHRVGLVWDGSHRILYIDGVDVARDTQASLAGSTGSLTIGAGSTMAPGSFWKGLIDDVRIYNRAVEP